MLKTGTIEFGERVLPCVARTLSSLGATLEIQSPLWFPDRFTLVVASESLRVTCHLVWRNGRRIGVSFVA